MGSEVIKGTSDLSLRDSGSFVLWEYSVCLVFALNRAQLPVADV